MNRFRTLLAAAAIYIYGVAGACGQTTAGGRAAGLGEVAPHDLRRSVAGALQESGVSIDKISRLLRHANVAVTERYLSKLPKVNEGAILISDVLGLETDLDLD